MQFNILCELNMCERDKYVNMRVQLKSRQQIMFLCPHEHETGFTCSNESICFDWPLKEPF